MIKLYTIRDVLAGFGVVHAGIPCIVNMPGDEYARRVVRDAVASNQPNAFNTNPEDKELWCVGEFDDVTGEIKPCKPYLVAKAVDYLGRKEEAEDVNQSN